MSLSSLLLLPFQDWREIRIKDVLENVPSVVGDLTAGEISDTIETYAVQLNKGKLTLPQAAEKSFICACLTIKGFLEVQNSVAQRTVEKVTMAMAEQGAPSEGMESVFREAVTSDLPTRALGGLAREFVEETSQPLVEGVMVEGVRWVAREAGRDVARGAAGPASGRLALARLSLGPAVCVSLVFDVALLFVSVWERYRDYTRGVASWRDLCRHSILRSSAFGGSTGLRVFGTFVGTLVVPGVGTFVGGVVGGLLGEMGGARLGEWLDQTVGESFC